MTYRFRIRWRLEHGRSFDGLEQPLTVNLTPEAGECELKAVGGETLAGGQGLALKSGPFESAEVAKAVGEKALAGLILASLRRGFGLSIQARIPSGHITEYGKRFFFGSRLDTIYDDTYGLAVFEEIGRTGFVATGELRPSITAPATSFVEAWSASTGAAFRWDESILISYDLYASSRFENSSRARSPLLVMAIEALVEQSERSTPEAALIDRLLNTISEAGLPIEQATALLSGVRALKRVSIGHACRTYVARSIAAGVVTEPGAAAHFMVCNRIRSQSSGCGSCSLRGMDPFSRRARTR